MTTWDVSTDFLVIGSGGEEGLAYFESIVGDAAPNTGAVQS